MAVATAVAALALPAALALLLSSGRALAQTQTPLAGHYPPGQSGLRGAACPAVGWSLTNFNRFFSNLEMKNGSGAAVQDVDEVRYANITMITWTTTHRFLGMSYGAMAGIPFSTGNLNPSDGDTENSQFGLGDVLLTPVALSGRDSSFDYTIQLTAWSASGRYSPGALDNRGSGFWALVYSLGGVWYPTQDRREWAVSALARIEQNLEQKDTGVTPGDDLVIDWGIGKTVQAGGRPLDCGVSGFATWQLTDQSSDDPADPIPGRYRYFGIGPEANIALSDRFAFRVRAHWEFDARNAVQGNNLWLIFNVRL
ncbi:MAG: SphA family protein [Candidatus Eiseniibacteriota bacterium]